jgi:hypothetical protein
MCVYIYITWVIVAFVTGNNKIIGLQESFYCYDQSQESCCHISISSSDLLLSYHPPQVQGGWVPMRSLSWLETNLFEQSSLVNISTSWAVLAICSNRRTPLATHSLKKWTSISICFVQWWKTGFLAIVIALILSQYNFGGGRQ